MKRLALAAVAVLSLVAPASAGVMSFFTLEPPKKYQVEPKIPVQVYRMTMAELQKACFNKSPFGLIYGCSKTLKGPDRCAVFIPKRPVYNIGFPLPPILIITPAMILKHELAHCAGWPRTHSR